jgi:hypothetical protein
MLLLLPFVDLLAISFSRYVYPDEKVHHNRRWFLIHTFVNGLVTYYNWNDLCLCFKDPHINPSLPMSNGAFFATNIMIWAHIYHMIVFYPYLKPDEWFHHLLMFTFNGISVYIFKNKAQAASAFFLSGFPGFFDYFLLWCVKMKFISPLLEKNIYLYITTFVRSPGAVSVTLISIPSLLSCKSSLRFWYSAVLIGLNFWNGQYYMMRNCIDYGKWITRQQT